MEVNLYIFVLSFACARLEAWNHSNQFNNDIFLCLSQVTTWISNVISRGLFVCVQIVKERGDGSFC